MLPSDKKEGETVLSGAFIFNKQFPPSLLLCCGEAHILINFFIDDSSQLPNCIFSEIQEGKIVLQGALNFCITTSTLSFIHPLQEVGN